MRLIIWFIGLCILSLFMLGVLIESDDCLQISKLYSLDDYESMKTQIFGELKNNCGSDVINASLRVRVLYIFDSGWVEDDYELIPCEVISDKCEFNTSEYDIHKSMRYYVKII